MRKSKFVNGNRKPENRKVRYCFLKHIGFSAIEARRIRNFRDSNIIRIIEQLGIKAFNGECIEINCKKCLSHFNSQFFWYCPFGLVRL